MAKYQDVFNDMVDTHKELFTEFKKVHDAFLNDPEAYKKEFNEKGQEIQRIIRRYENILCGRSEGGRYGKYSANLSEKFWNHIRTYFPKIDQIGMQ